LAFCGGKRVPICEVASIQIMYLKRKFLLIMKKKPLNHNDHERPQNKCSNIQPMKHNEK
jgi:hypothetical protein